MILRDDKNLIDYKKTTKLAGMTCRLIIIINIILFTLRSKDLTTGFNNDVVK